MKGMSLRWRVSLWNAGVIASTLAVLTGATIYGERRQFVRAEVSNATALLEHLAHMPQFQSDVETVASHLALMRESLRTFGSDIDVVSVTPEGPRATDEGASRVTATRTLALRDGAFRLRYLTNPDRLQGALRESIAMHLLYGLVALTALLGGTEWILRKNLIMPLRSLSRQIESMRDGRGWLRKERETDEELTGVARAVADLGPALERQVGEWIEAERRSAVALAIHNVRRRLVDPWPRDLSEATTAGTQFHAAQAGDDGCGGAFRTQREQVDWALAEEERATFGETPSSRREGISAPPPKPDPVVASPAAASTKEVVSFMEQDSSVIIDAVGRPRISLRGIAFASGDLVFMIGVTATAAWVMNVGHQPRWGVAVGMVVGMSLAMLVQTTLAFAAAPVLGSIETMVPTMVAAMAGSTAVCLLHLFGREPTSATALQVGVGFGVLVFCLIKAYAWRFRQSLGRRRG